MTAIEKLTEAAKKAVDKVHSFMGVSRDKNVAELKDIRGHIEVLIESLEADGGDDE